MVLDDFLMESSTLLIKQQLERLEVLTGFETRNRYTIHGRGRVLFAAEESSTAGLLFLRSARPLTLRVMDGEGNVWLYLTKPFCFWLNRAVVADHYSQPLAALRQHFVLLHRRFSVLTPAGTAVGGFRAEWRHPWTFDFSYLGQPAGRAVKKWSGLGREAFTDADRFELSYPDSLPLEARKLLLAAGLFIDLTYFEAGQKGSLLGALAVRE